MYVSKIKIISDRPIPLVEDTAKGLEDLGFFITEKDPEVLVYFNSISSVIRDISKKITSREKDPVVIAVTGDGSYVIPLINERRGGSFIGGIIADMLESQLILTSVTAQMGIYSVEEFAWINGLVIRDGNIEELDRKQIELGKLKVFTKLELRYPPGFERSSCDEADIVVGEECRKDGKILMTPLNFVIGIGYNRSTPSEALYYSIVSTLRSIGIFTRNLNFIVTSKHKKGDEKIERVARSFNSTVIYADWEKSDIGEIECDPSLDFLKVKLLLKKTKRAYGVVTCLGVEA
ncbi:MULTISPECIES: cobalt-precorrin 5A hydrolase [Acidianus]|uniref:Cobalamin biosynthesis protein CbiG n=1 Tax=Candidatus Acidianus copahuensis TaxID=1160895 RepID=A0A031LKT2_9CREN|nr:MULTISPECIES: cobalt-precorrin 5A hydrolase [Acidianus]EZQ02105.1 cobalamin biosynthesis protein CbiG [Candidatus Acidianus copahuensis]NON62048.1 cobalt-precorrin 5A hydrolase [Acidianus sp. RZ1]